MAAAGGARLRRAASALLLRSPRLPARELSAPARLYHKKVAADEEMRETLTGKGAGGRVPRKGPRLLIIMKILETWGPLTRHQKMLELDWWGLQHVVM